jgi:hypothetical protein
VLIVGGNQSAGGYDVDNSLRFNSGSSDYLNRTPSSSSNRKTWTWSAWVKRAKIGSGLFEAMWAVDPSPRQYIAFYQDKLYSYGTNGGDILEIFSTALFRDLSAWYHIVFVFDTTEATGSDRVKVYINGVQQTLSFSITPSLNRDGAFNTTQSHTIGGENSSFPQFNGYMSEVVFIDGQALDPTSFGEFDGSSGIWKPIDVSGLTFGTNGYYLDFENSGSLGADVSGNGNNFTVNNLTSIDQTTDTPTNNYATANGLDLSGGNLSEGNTKLTADGGWDGVRATVHYPSSGKWYAELYVNSRTTGVSVGVLRTDRNILGDLGNDVGAYVYNSGDGRKYNNGGNSAYGATWGTGDTISVLWDADTNTLVFYKNGVSQGTAWSGLTGEYGLAFNCNGSDSATINFGNPSITISSGNSDGNGYGNFEYAVPSGYYALNTKNLAEYG